MKYKYIFISLIMFLSVATKAQEKAHSLSIGDSLPNIKISKLINFNKQQIQTSDFKNQLLIIDFWATSCPGCVEQLPKLDSLQNQFSKSIKILPVTYESKPLVIKFWNANRYTKKLHLSSIVEDKVFSSYFKHKDIPHEVWIYKNKIVGITSADYIDSYHIKQILTGMKIDWPVKYDFYVYDGSKQPLFTLDTNQIDLKSTFIKYAAISDYKEKVNSEGFTGGSGTIRNIANKSLRTYFLNQPIFTSYFLSWSSIVHMDTLIKPSFILDPNQVVWEVSDKSKYTYDRKWGYRQDWVRKHAICFESVNPDTGQTDLMVSKTIVNDLDRLLGLHVRWERRKEKILKLVILSKEKLISDHGIANVHQTSLSDFVNNLNQQAENPYVFDETKYNDRLNIDFKLSSWTDIQTIRNIIRTYGLDLVEDERYVDKFVFSEVNGGMLVDRKMISDAKERRINSIKDAKLTKADDDLSFFENNKHKLGVISISSGIQYKILHQGLGPKPLSNDKIRVNYTGMLTDEKIFESSYETGKPFDTKLSDVIQGWQEVLPMMNVGSKWIVYIPAKLAYGEHTMQGTLPPNSTLIFELELLQIIK